MAISKSRLPTTASLLAFQEVARCGSFTQAADKLGMTQSALSKQVKNAEETLGCALIERRHGGMRLTQQGARYLAEISPHLEGLAKASGQLAASARERSVVRLRGLASFCDKWLLPRLPEFGQLHPGISIEFSSLLLISDPRLQASDLEIRFGAGPWPGKSSMQLTGEEVLLVASPAFLARTPCSKLADINGLARLEHLQATDIWEHFNQHHELEPSRNNVQPSRFEVYSVLISAAVNGMGIGLVPQCLIAPELASGLLIELEFGRMTSRDSYHLVWDAKANPSKAVQIFRHWLIDSAELCRAARTQTCAGKHL